ncbi:MAG: dihydroorotase [Candidatus Peregrinibacteria bacterium Gr01-1014_25]|nr:MAG: dihydroorotase [Candidatus Peregrinibacteria bacterium Gr01-1014_25]
MSALLIANGHVVDPAGKVDGIADVLVENGVIARVGKNLKPKSAQVVNAKGKLVTPGLVDLHVHLREPGREDKETIETGLRAALAGGITSVVSMPNTTPETDNQTVVEFQLSKARKLGLARLFVAGRITKGGQRIAEMWELKNTGAVAVTDDGHDVDDACLLLHSLEWAKTFDIPLITHAEIASLSHGGVMHEGKVSQLLGLQGQSANTEVLAIQKSIALAEEVGARLHIAHVTTARGVDEIRRAQKRGVRVTAEVTPQHVSLTHEECLGWNTSAKMHPPLREEEDVRAMHDALRDGTLTAIATDHAPHLVSEKLLPFQIAPVGTVGLETSFAVVNTYLIRKKVLPLKLAIERMTSGPASALGLPAGTLRPGAAADISIFDPDIRWIVDPWTFQSKGRNSVFAGKTLYGKATDVFVGGVPKLRDGVVL